MSKAFKFKAYICDEFDSKQIMKNSDFVYVYSFISKSLNATFDVFYDFNPLNEN